MDANQVQPAETAEDTAKRLTTETIMMAVANTRSLLQEMTTRGLDPNASFAQVRDSFDANLRIAASYFDPKKNQAPTAAPFKLTINLPNTPNQGALAQQATIVVESSVEDDASVFDNVPAYVSAVPLVSNLAPEREQ